MGLFWTSELALALFTVESEQESHLDSQSLISSIAFSSANYVSNHYNGNQDSKCSTNYNWD